MTQAPASDKPLRVLFVNENIGGHATVHEHLRRALLDRSDVCPTFLDVPPPSLFRRAVGTRLPGLQRYDADLQALRAQLALSAWVARRLRTDPRSYDVVHLYTQNAGLLAASWLRQRPCVVSFDGTTAVNAYRLAHRRPGIMTPATVSLSKPFERKVFGAADLLSASSRWAAASLRADYGITGAHVRILPFGIIAPTFPPGPAPGTSTTGRPRIVFVGRSLLRKGGQRLLELHQEHLRSHADLVLVTKDAVPSLPGVTVIDDLDPGSTRLWDVLRSGAVFAFPSEVDQAPNAVLEAMAAGLPVISTDTAAIPEMVQDDVTGLIVKPGSSAGLRTALERLLAHPSERARMGAAGRERFAACYDGHHTTDLLLRALREAVTLHEASAAHSRTQPHA